MLRGPKQPHERARSPPETSPQYIQPFTSLGLLCARIAEDQWSRKPDRVATRYGMDGSRTEKFGGFIKHLKKTNNLLKT